jgi:hypothetical protein
MLPPKSRIPPNKVCLTVHELYKSHLGGNKSLKVLWELFKMPSNPDMTETVRIIIMPNNDFSCIMYVYLILVAKKMYLIYGNLRIIL